MVLPSLADANAAAEDLRKLPQVARAMTLESFVPDNQPRKLAAIRTLDRQLGPVLQAEDSARHPTDAQTVAAFERLGCDADAACRRRQVGRVPMRPAALLAI